MMLDGGVGEGGGLFVVMFVIFLVMFLMLMMVLIDDGSFVMVLRFMKLMSA